MLPSFHASTDNARAWNVARAAFYGAALGAAAALVKILGPWHAGGSAAARALEVAAAAIAFALLCAGAAALRNFVARRLIWPQMR